MENDLKNSNKLNIRNKILNVSKFENIFSQKLLQEHEFDRNTN